MELRNILAPSSCTNDDRISLLFLNIQLNNILSILVNSRVRIWFSHLFLSISLQSTFMSTLQASIFYSHTSLKQRKRLYKLYIELRVGVSFYFTQYSNYCYRAHILNTVTYTCLFSIQVSCPSNCNILDFTILKILCFPTINLYVFLVSPSELHH